MRLRFAVIRPEIGSDALFFKLAYLCFLVCQVKDAPLFSRRVFAGVRFDLLVHSWLLL